MPLTAGSRLGRYAILAKIGVEDINSDLATFIRTIVVLVSLALILFATGKFATPGTISTRSWIFLVLSGLGTGASWLCYFRDATDDIPLAHPFQVA